MKRRHLRNAIGIIVLVAFVGLTAWYLAHNWEDFASLSIENPLALVPAVLLMLIGIYGNGTVIDLAIEPHGVKLTKKEIAGLAVVTRFTNQVAFGYVGAAIRATYLKRTKGVAFAKFSSSFVVSNLLQYMMSGVIILASWFLLGTGSGSVVPLVIVGLCVVLFVCVLYVPIGRMTAWLRRLEDRGTRTGKIAERLRVAVEGLATVRSYPGLLPKTMGWMLVNIGTQGGTFFFLYASLGFDVPFAAALFVGSLSTWSIIFSLTPGNIGIREGLMLVAAQLAGVSLPATLLVGILFRLITFAVSGLLSLYFYPMIAHPRTRGPEGMAHDG